jgi:type IV pilus assembly protein PilN
MLEFNLLPWRESLRARNRRYFLRAIVWVVLGVALLSGGAGYLVRQDFAVQQLRNHTVRQQLAALEPSLEALRTLHERGAELAQRTAVLQTLEQQRTQDALLLDALARVVPDGLHYTTLAREGAALRLEGMATGAGLTALMRALATFPFFAAPELRDIAAPQADERSPFALFVPLRIDGEGAP